MNEKNKIVVLSFFETLMNQYRLNVYIDNSEEVEEKKVFRIEQLQGFDLANINEVEFDNLKDVLIRLKPYHHYYIYETLDERKLDNEVIAKYDYDYIAKKFTESDLIGKALEKITPKEYLKLLNKVNEVNNSDIMYVIQAEDRIYENVCKKYLATFSNEMVIENNNEIIHFLINDMYVDLKDEGKININNYQKYLDDFDCIYRYDSFRELFRGGIEYEICNDIENEGLFDEDNKWKFYLSFEELKQVDLEYQIKDYYPLIKKYIITNENITDFFKHFNLEQLNRFEKALHLFYETFDIKYDKETGTIYSENYNFNVDILKLSERLISYDDFIKLYTKNEYQKDLVIEEKTFEYFKENEITDLMRYGSDGEEGLLSISKLYENLLDELDIKYKDVYTEDISDGKFQTTITLDDSEIIIQTNAWNSYEIVADNLIDISEKYDEHLSIKNEIDMETEMD